MYNYIRDMSNGSTFVTSVLKVLIEERQNTHRERWNLDNAATPFKIGDVAKVHVQVQSNSKTRVIKIFFLS